MSEKTYFFYSAKQEAAIRNYPTWADGRGYVPNYARLDDGRASQFTEQRDSPTPISEGDDIEHLGTGVYFGHSPTSPIEQHPAQKPAHNGVRTGSNDK